jgi:hypothetical protein
MQTQINKLHLPVQMTRKIYQYSKFSDPKFKWMLLCFFAIHEEIEFDIQFKDTVHFFNISNDGDNLTIEITKKYGFIKNSISFEVSIEEQLLIQQLLLAIFTNYDINQDFFYKKTIGKFKKSIQLQNQFQQYSNELIQLIPLIKNEPFDQSQLHFIQLLHILRLRKKKQIIIQDQIKLKQFDSNKMVQWTIYCYKTLIQKKDFEFYFNDSTYMNVYVDDDDDDITLSIIQKKNDKKYTIECMVHKNENYIKTLLYYIFQIFSFKKKFEIISNSKFQKYKDELFQNRKDYSLELSSSQNEFLLLLKSIL